MVKREDLYMRVLTVIMPRQLHKKLERIKQKMGLSKSYIVRQMIIKCLDQERAA
jgi:metal-responsive CopG/Arc/MetJ family transcriptional regulator